MSTLILFGEKNFLEKKTDGRVLVYHQVVRRQCFQVDLKSLPPLYIWFQLVDFKQII